MSWSLLLYVKNEKKVREELTMALVEAREGGLIDNGVDGSMPMESFNELVREMTSKRQDLKAFAFRTKAMVIINNCHPLVSFACHFPDIGCISLWVAPYTFQSSYSYLSFFNKKILPNIM